MSDICEDLMKKELKVIPSAGLYRDEEEFKFYTLKYTLRKGNCFKGVMK